MRRFDPTAGDPAAGVPSCWLEWGRRRFPLPVGEHVVGRDPDVEIRLDRSTVSRRHARLVVTAEGTSLEDVASKNGTFRGNDRVTSRVALANGDAIRIGALLVTFHVVPSAAPPTHTSSRPPPTSMRCQRELHRSVRDRRMARRRRHGRGLPRARLTPRARSCDQADSEAIATDASRVRRFEQEARAAGQLNHPNILAVHDVGSHEGAPYIVSELLEGSSLRQLLSGTALPPRKAIDYARQTAEGLAAAHDKAIVHRDVKPDNLFITSDGRVKILDFGIAKLTAPSDDASGPPACRRTPIPEWWWARPATCRPSRSAANPSIPAPTSSVAEPSSTRCSPAVRRSPATRRPRRWPRS